MLQAPQGHRGGAPVLLLPAIKKGGEPMQDLLPQIANFGFPIVLSMYLLIRVEGKLEVLSQAIAELTRAILSSQYHQ